MAGQNDIFAGLIIAFIMVVVGIALLTSSADTIATVVDTFESTNEYTLINNTGVQLIAAGTNLTGVSAVINGSMVCNETSDWVSSNANGTITLVAGGCLAGDYNVTYSYQTNSFIDDSGTRSIVALIVIFFALAIAMAVLGEIPIMDMGFGRK